MKNILIKNSNKIASGSKLIISTKNAKILLAILGLISSGKLSKKLVIINSVLILKEKVFLNFGA